jgi:hypothetical protein
MMKLMFSEYLKYVAARMRIRFDPASDVRAARAVAETALVQMPSDRARSAGRYRG